MSPFLSPIITPKRAKTNDDSSISHCDGKWVRKEKGVEPRNKWKKWDDLNLMHWEIMKRAQTIISSIALHETPTDNFFHQAVPRIAISIISCIHHYKIGGERVTKLLPSFLFPKPEQSVLLAENVNMDGPPGFYPSPFSAELSLSK